MKKLKIDTGWNMPGRVSTEDALPMSMKSRKIMSLKEPIGEAVAGIHQERSVGVQPLYDIRTDKWEIALEAMTKAMASDALKRAENQEAARQAMAENRAKEPDNSTKS